MKRNFSQAAVVSILLNGCTTWTLTNRTERKLDENCTRMLRVILSKSWKQYPTKYQKRTEGDIGRNVVSIAIKMRSIVRLFEVIKKKPFFFLTCRLSIIQPLNQRSPPYQWPYPLNVKNQPCLLSGLPLLQLSFTTSRHFLNC